MGVYLSSPVTEKESVNDACPEQGFCYGASSMQGWRISQEDAHNCIPVFDKKTKTSFFAVYDGHGGSEVAKYCELHFPDFVKEFLVSSDSLDTEPTKFIQSAFLGFDATLTSEDIIKELKILAGKEDDLDEDEEDENVYRNETELLKEEATMPLDQLLAQYSSSSDKGALKENVNATAECSSSSAENGPQPSVDKPSSSSVSSSSSPSNAASSSSSSSHVNNGKSKALENTSSQGSSNTEETSTNNNCESSSLASSDIALSSSSGTDGAKENSADKNKSKIAADSSPTVSSSTPSLPNKAGSSSKQSDGSSGSSGSSGSGSVSGMRSSKAKAAADIAKVGADSDDDDDDDEEEEDVWEDMSDDDDDDDDEEDAEGDQGENVPMMDTSDEEPGSDSGCTACVLLKQGNKLIVANAGDSRCVLARDGKAIDLSFDHKPEDEPEKSRIEKAGGKVTGDGRVNGGLNLSRAIGDHVYKRNTEVSAREQMITALPDVQMEELGEKDQFIVIACDGIWNYMSSQEVVDYVLKKLKDPVKRKQPSIICEEMFDHCLAPNTYGDGTGCDNMTCIIIVLDTFQHTEEDGDKEETVDQNSDVNTEEQTSVSVKRGLDDADDNEAKRQKVEEDGV